MKSKTKPFGHLSSKLPHSESFLSLLLFGVLLKEYNQNAYPPVWVLTLYMAQIKVIGFLLYQRKFRVLEGESSPQDGEEWTNIPKAFFFFSSSSHGDLSFALHVLLWIMEYYRIYLELKMLHF